MQELATTQDARISQYSFGQSISQFGVTVYSCKFAKQGKKIFGNDPDPVLEIVLPSQDDIVTEHIKKYPKGIVASIEDEVRDCGKYLQVHHRTVMFGSTWRSDSLRPAHRSLLYHNGSHTHFRFNGLARMISQEEHGISSCQGYEDMHATNRRCHFYKESGAFTPTGKGSILVPMHDCWFHKQKLKQHFPYPVSVDHTVQITVDKPTLIIEFTREEPDVAEFARTWLQQVEDGLIEIIDR